MADYTTGGGWGALAESTAHLPALGMGLMSLKEREGYHGVLGDIANQRLAIGQEKADALQSRIDALNTLREAQAEKAQAQTPFHLQSPRPSEFLLPQVATQQEYGKPGADAMSPLWDYMQKLHDTSPGASRGEIYAATKSAWPSIQEGIAGSLEKSITSGKLSPAEMQKAQALYDTVKTDADGSRTLDQGVFSNTFKSIQDQEANTKAKLAELKTKEQRVTHAPPGSAIIDPTTGDIIGMVPKDTTAADLARQDKADRQTEKDAEARKNKTVQQIDNYIRVNYTNKRKELEKQMAKVGDTDRKWYQDAIDAIDAEEEKMNATKNHVLNGGGIVWPSSTAAPAATPQQAPTGNAPTVGEERLSGGRRWKFLGGDPASPKSWEQVK